jgi:hypothetical protein
MHLSTKNTLKFLCSNQLKFGKTIIRTLFNPFASKQIESAKDAHSNLLTDAENVFELQHHTIKPSSMVNYFFSRIFEKKKDYDLTNTYDIYNPCKNKKTIFCFIT